MTDDERLSELLKVASAAVDQAATLVRKQVPNGRPTVKSDRDIATEVDYLVEREVRRFLAEATPELGFLGEEEGASDGAANDLPYWVLDPIDGTSNFAHGLPLCSVSLGLIRDQVSIVGVVDLPFLGERYEAIRGGGARLNGIVQQRGPDPALSQAIVAIGDYAIGENAGERNQVRLQLTALLAAKVERVRMFGSAAIDLAWVAAGRLDASLMLANKPWDTAAGVLLAREAGAAVCDLDGSPHTVTSSGTIAVAGGLREQLLGLLEEAGAA
ncbi:MAG: inositol monophosphatase family protein [Pseudonocardiaceae bacterium]